MVAEAPQRLRDDALAFFRDPALPESLAWVDDLDAFHQRLFAVELADALKAALLRDDDRDLAILIEDWEATAEVMSSPEVVAEIMRPKRHRPLSDFTGQARVHR